MQLKNITNETAAIFPAVLFLKSEKIGTEHMLLAMLKDGDCVATKILATMNVNLGKIQEDILETIGINPKEYFETSLEYDLSNSAEISNASF